VAELDVVAADGVDLNVVVGVGCCGSGHQALLVWVGPRRVQGPITDPRARPDGAPTWAGSVPYPARYPTRSSSANVAWLSSALARRPAAVRASISWCACSYAHSRGRSMGSSCSRIVEDLAHRAEVPVPRLYLIPSEQPNAFATGRNPQHAAVAVTEGLLEQLPADQVRGVLAHEFAHIKNHDILISSIAAMVAGAISAIATVLQFSMLFGGSDEEDSPLGLIGTLAAIIVAPIAAMLLQLGISRQREYLADATGAQLLGRAAPLADALENLERGAQALPMNVNPAEASLYAVNPLPRRGLATLFMTHPPIAERIRRLRALDGGRVVALAA
jgi:heat shock protein HtpX